MIMPGVQKPHWRAWHSWKAACTACRVPPSARPSMVVTSCPLACTARTLHDFTLRPSRWTVHAPQLLVSQPITVPVLPRRSRRYCTSSMRGSMSSETVSPSTVSSILVINALLGTQGCDTPHARSSRLAEGWSELAGARRQHGGSGAVAADDDAELLCDLAAGVGLVQEAVSTELEGLLRGSAVAAEAGQHHDHGLGAGLADDRQRLETVEDRHRDVEQDHVGQQLGGDVHAGLAVGRLADDVEVVL